MPARVFYADQARALLYHARAATPFCSPDGEPCASVPSSLDSRRIFPLRSAAFRDWLTANYYNEYESAPSADALRVVLRTLEARARYGDSPPQKIDYRVSFEGDTFTPSKILLDLANAGGETIEITSQGWSIRDNLQNCFREFSSTLPLPHPQRASAGHDALHAMSELLRLSPTNRARILTWIAAALRPAGPYPVLVLKGPAASGKSFLARVLRALIDPSAAPLRRLPLRDRELLHLAFENWILAFDHVQRIPSRISQALCALSTGDALELTQPDYREPVVFQIARPIILTVPNDETQRAWMPLPTLSHRTLTIELPPIAALRPESAIWSAFEALRPAMLAVLCDAIATALRRIRDIDLGNVGRFPDCAAWAAAAAPALGLEESAIMEMFSDPESVWTGSDPLRDAVYGLLRQNPVWSGDATTLLNRLRAAIPFAALPNTAKGLSQALAHVPGIRITRSRDSQGQRVLSITKTAPVSQSAANDVTSPYGAD
jgi:hypothetical protein